MGWDDILENKQQRYHQEHRKDHSFGHNRYISDNDHHYQPAGQYALHILTKIRTNRKLKFLLLGLVVSVIALLIFILIMIIPLIGGLIDIVKQEGLKGISESAMGFIEKLWNGAGKR
jgi:uncharacterized membrane protein